MRTLTIITIMTVLLIFAGCSSNGNPSVPHFEGGVEISDQTVPYAPIVSYSKDGTTSYQSVFGAWHVQVDLENLSWEIIPSRNASKIGDIFDADLSQFLTVSPCSNCLTIGGMSFDAYEALTIDFRMKHPFGNIATRPDLHGFDVRGIIIGANDTIPTTYSSIKVIRPDGAEEFASFFEYLLWNPDGYTSHFDGIVRDERYFVGAHDIPGNLNPFLRFYESYATPPFDPHNPSGHNVMKVGASYSSRTGVFNLGYPGAPAFDFYFVADVSYGQSAVLANRTDPLYFLPAFHRTEPWRAEYWIENNNLSDSDPNSTADLMVQVFDWQHNATVDPNYPDPGNLSGIPESSDVLQIELSIPSMMNDPVIVTTPESGDGSPTNPLTYRIQVTNQNQQWYLVNGMLAIRDELHGAAAPSGRLPIPESPAGFPYATQDIRDYSLYMPIRINIPTRSSDGYEDTHELDLNLPDLTTSWSTQIKPTFFMDYSHKKFQYRWDYDYDGVTFDVEGAGLPSDWIDLLNQPGKRDVGLRIRTNSVPPREHIFAIPVYGVGNYFREHVTSASANMEATSRLGKKAIGETVDNVYLAYTSSVAGQDDIWLAIGDHFGNYTQHVNLTEGFNGTCQHPALVVVENGVDAGVYVVFEYYNGIFLELHSTYGNLDGSGFDSSNIKPISTGMVSSARYANLIYHESALYAYYDFYSTFTLDMNIVCASSSDMGQTWTPYGLVNSITTNAQACTNAVFDDDFDRVTCAWQDSSSHSTLGIDVMIATSQSNLLDFNMQKRVSISFDQIDETNPDLAFVGDSMVVAYNVSGSDSDIYVMFLDKIYPTFTLIEAKEVLTGSDQGPPTICSTPNRSIILAYTSYKSGGDLKLTVSEIKASKGGPGSIFETNLAHWTIGSFDNLDAPCQPAVLCNYVPRNYWEPYAVETIVAWTDYTLGDTNRTIYDKLYYGIIDTAGFLADWGY